MTENSQGPKQFNQIAIGRLPNIFGFNVTLEWNISRSGVRVTVFDADWDPLCRTTHDCKEVGIGVRGEPLLSEAVMGLLWPVHIGVSGTAWLEHPPTVVWECADHDDIAWCAAVEVDRVTRAKVGGM